jgi:D-3-phosphoglycerate dehydrogenase / 2-oxoglutarate reductase
VRVLIIGDSFVPVEAFEGPFDVLSRAHDVRYASIDDSEDFEAATPSERKISEFLGSPQRVTELVGDAEVLVVHAAPVTEEVMRAASDLRLLGCVRGGAVNVDVDAATRLGLPVTLSPGKNATAVADLTLAFMVMLARRIVDARESLAHDGGHLGSTFDGARFIGHELVGATLGLVGYGNVGRQVAKRALGYQMDVVVYDPHVPRGDNGVAFAETLPELLARSDFVSLHARSTPETRGIIDARALATMKPGAWLINTARETLIDETAVAKALSDGHLAGVALDVLGPAAPGTRHPLIDDPRVLVTPHIGGATHETLIRGAQMIAEAVAAFADGGDVPRLANPTASGRGSAR